MFHFLARQSLSQCVLSHLYKALILPKLDYYSSVWDPFTSIYVDRLESGLQQRFCTRHWSEPLPLSTLGWPNLDSRLKIRKVMLCRRILRNQSIILLLFSLSLQRATLILHHSNTPSLLEPNLFNQFLFVICRIVYMYLFLLLFCPVLISLPSCKNCVFSK